MSIAAAGPIANVTYAVVDTGQTACYDATSEITAPAPGDPFYGQDAQYDPSDPLSSSSCPPSSCPPTALSVPFACSCRNLCPTTAVSDCNAGRCRDCCTPPIAGTDNT